MTFHISAFTFTSFPQSFLQWVIDLFIHSFAHYLPCAYCVPNAKPSTLANLNLPSLCVSVCSDFSYQSAAPTCFSLSTLWVFPVRNRSLQSSFHQVETSQLSSNEAFCLISSMDKDLLFHIWFLPLEQSPTKYRQMVNAYLITLK